MLFQRNPRQIRRPGGPRRYWALALYIGCALTLVPSLFIHPHAKFSFAEIPAFHAMLAFVTGCVLVLVAQLVRWVLMRPDDYYDSEEN